jgi:hypothetical protein
MPFPCFTEVKYGDWVASLILVYMRFLKQVLKGWDLISSLGIILFYLAQMRAAPQVRALAGCYGRNVSFSFDSNGRSVWVMARFGRGAPPFTLLRLGAGHASRRPLRGLLTMNGIYVSRRLRLRTEPFDFAQDRPDEVTGPCGPPQDQRDLGLECPFTQSVARPRTRGPQRSKGAMPSRLTECGALAETAPPCDGRLPSRTASRHSPGRLPVGGSELLRSCAGRSLSR